MTAAGAAAETGSGFGSGSSSRPFAAAVSSAPRSSGVMPLNMHAATSPDTANNNGGGGGGASWCGVEGLSATNRSALAPLTSAGAAVEVAVEVELADDVAVEAAVVAGEAGARAPRGGQGETGEEETPAAPSTRELEVGIHAAPLLAPRSTPVPP